MAARRLHHAAAERSPSSSPSERAPGQQLTTLRVQAANLWGFLGELHVSRSCARAKHRGTPSEGEKPYIDGMKRGLVWE